MTLFIYTVYLLIKFTVILTALTVLLSFSVAWYERANSSPALIDRRFTLRGVGLPVWLMVQETACLLITLALRPFGWFDPKIKSEKAGIHRPVVLIHGLFQNRACLFWLEHRLRKSGIANIYSINTPPWRELEDLTETLAKKVDEIRLALGIDRVDLVGHSMGGIIGRHYVQNRGGADKVNHLITIGAPHHGSKLAPFAVSKMGRELLPGSDFLRRFNSTKLPDGPQYTSIYTRYDNIVLPATNCRLDGATNIELDGMGHTALLFHPRSLLTIAEALKEPARNDHSEHQ